MLIPFCHPQLQSLSMSLNDSTMEATQRHEQVQQLQQGLASSEKDRRVLQERLDAARYVTICLYLTIDELPEYCESPRKFINIKRKS